MNINRRMEREYFGIWAGYHFCFQSAVINGKVILNVLSSYEPKFHPIGHNAQGNLYKIATSLEFPMRTSFNPLSASFTKWSNTSSVFDHFVGLALKGLSCSLWIFLPISLFCSLSIILISLYDVKYNGKRQFVDS